MLHRLFKFATPRKKAIIIQVIALLTVLLFAAFIANNSRQNLAALGQNIDFSFLEDVAGFPLSQHLISYSDSDSYGRVFAVGILNTLLAAALAILLATLLGVMLGVAQLSPNWLLRQITRAYVEIFRNIPLLLHLFFWYFTVLAALPRPRESQWLWSCDAAKSCLLALTNRGIYLATVRANEVFTRSLTLLFALFALLLFFYIINRYYYKKYATRRVARSWYVGCILVTAALLALQIPHFDWQRPALYGFNFRGGVTILPELIALVVALTLYSAAFIAEYVRGGIVAVERGQYEAAYSLGLSRLGAMRLIILPQALRIIVPPLTNQYLNIVKNSSLAAAIAYPDLVSIFTGTTLNQTGRAIEIISLTMAVYLTISIVIAVIMNVYNRRVKLY